MNVLSNICLCSCTSCDVVKYTSYTTVSKIQDHITLVMSSRMQYAYVAVPCNVVKYTSYTTVSRIQ